MAKEGLVALFCPAFEDVKKKLNIAGLQKVENLRAGIPFGAPLEIDSVPLFLWVLAEKLNPKEKDQLIKSTRMLKAEVEAWRGLPVRARRRERGIASPKLQKPSALYTYLSSIPGEDSIWLHLNTNKRPVRDRIKNYFQKYLITALEITDSEVAEHFRVEDSSEQFATLREEYVAGRLDGKIRKKIPPPVPEVAPPPAPRRGRFARSARTV